VVSRTDGTAACERRGRPAEVHALPPLATAATLLATLDAPCGSTLCVDGAVVRPTTRLRMGDVVRVQRSRDGREPKKGWWAREQQKTFEAWRAL
jgi:hypothetical protein